MTLPNGPDGVDTAQGLFLTSAYGYGTQSIADLTGNDQDTVKGVYKDRFMGGAGSVWGDPSSPLAGVFGGLAGIPGLLGSLLGKLFGGTFNGSVEDLLANVKRVPGLDNLVEAITGQEDGDLDDIGTWFLNWRSFFGALDFTDPDFDPTAAVTTFIELVLWPANKIARLIGGFIPGVNIPGLDAMQIVSGTFPQTMVNGLVGFIDKLENAIKSIPGGSLISGVVGFWADFVNALLGHGPNVVPAYTFDNPVASALQGQMNAIKAQISSSGEGDSDGFDYPPLSADWTPIYNSAVVTDGGYVIAGHPGSAGAFYTCQRYNKTAPDTTLYQVNFTLVATGSPAGALAQGKHRFGIGNTTLSGGRFPVIEVDVNQFGAFIRFGSLTGPLNDYNLASVGWLEYFNVNLAGTLKSTDVLALEVDETNKIYRPYLNPGPGSNPLYTHVDNANNISRGAGNRWPFMQLNVINDVFQVGNGWDNFFVFDRV